MFVYDFGRRRETPCGDCDADGHCTMNCSPPLTTKDEPMQPEMKDVTPKKQTAEKERVRVQAGREGGPVGLAKPATVRNLPATSAPKGESKSILAIIADAAANPAVNPATMRELLDLQKDIMAEQSRRDFNAAFIALQSELPAIRRDGKIEIRAKDAKGDRSGPIQQSTPYATFNNIMKTIKPLLIKHGFALSFSTEPAGERLIVNGILEGHGAERRTAFPLPAETSGSKNNVQGWGSSMSYGKRYCTIALLNIISEAPEDVDSDGHVGNFKSAKGGAMVDVPEVATITPAQKDELLKKIEWCGVSLVKFHDHYGISRTGDLPAHLYDAAVKACEDHHANKQAKVRHG